MNLTDLDCTILQYDPTKDRDLKKLKESHEDYQQDLPGDLEKYRKSILRYIILFYDINTPLRIMYPNEYRRKTEAAQLAGFKFKQKNHKMTPMIEDILIGVNPVVNKMAIRYVLNFYNQDYLRLVVFKEMMGQMAREKMGSSDIKPNDVKTLNDLSKSIEDLQSKVFGGRESKEMKEELYKTIEQEYFNLHPDMVPKDLKENPDLFKDMGKELDGLDNFL